MRHDDKYGYSDSEPSLLTEYLNKIALGASLGLTAAAGITTYHAIPDFNTQSTNISASEAVYGPANGTAMEAQRALTTEETALAALDTSVPFAVGLAVAKNNRDKPHTEKVKKQEVGTGPKPKGVLRA